MRSSRVARLSAWLARALLADFPVIVFDEPTANVDPERASGLMRDILAAATGVQGEDSRTVIVISHTRVPEDLVTRVPEDLVTRRVRLGPPSPPRVTPAPEISGTGVTRGRGVPGDRMKRKESGS